MNVSKVFLKGVRPLLGGVRPLFGESENSYDYE